MWKLYLVWAILSSVTLLYIISKRCNVMSTIKDTQNGTCWRCFIWFRSFVLNLPQPPWLNTSKFRWKSFTQIRRLQMFFFPFCSHCRCEIYKEPCSAPSLNIDMIKKLSIFCIFFLCLSRTTYSRYGHSLSSDVTVSTVHTSCAGISILSIPPWLQLQYTQNPVNPTTTLYFVTIQV